jgi:hypothetical protein
MKWLFAAVLVLLAVLSPKFRKFGLVLAGLLILAMVIIMTTSRDQPAPATVAAPATAPIPSVGSTRMQDSEDYRIDRLDKEDPDAKGRIPLTAVRLVQVEPTFTPSGSMQSIHARLYNDSPRFTLTDYSYYLAVKDCIDAKSREPGAAECTTVYDQRSRGAPLTVPPQQARDITINLPSDPVTQAPPFKILGKARIALDVTDTRAYRSAQTPQPAVINAAADPGASHDP